MFNEGSNRFVPVHKMIGYWARKTPNAPAVIDGSRCLSYRRLHELGNRFALLLREKHGIGRGSLVVVRAENTAESILSITAILKAGGAYVPMDRSYPKKRREIILSESSADLLIVTDRVNEADLFQGPVVTLELEDLSEGDSSDLEVECSPADLAYVIYTSGSTGKPKGVVVEHGALSNNITWAADYYRRSVNELHFLLYTSLSFDGSATSYWAPLSSGGSVTVIKRGNTQALFEFVNSEQRVNALKITPGGLAALLDSSITLPGIRVLIVAGEEFRTGLARRARDLLGDNVAIFNSYGPSEATVNCLIHRFNGSESTPVVPIGRPIPGCLAVVLDENGKRVVGQPGELVIKGRCLARGYHNAPILTAEKFRTDLLADGERAYLTGDRALEDETGTFHFLGRLDSMIKLRGHRIDLEEVEHVLMNEGCFADVVVLVESAGHRHLAAFVVLKEAESVDLQRLKGRLREMLPEYMVPPAFYRVDQIPIGLHGKKDRGAVRNLRRSILNVAPAVPPRSENERMVVDIVAPLVGNTSISVTATLLELGVDSLLQIGIAARIEQRTGRRLALSDLRLDATLANIAHAIERAPRGTGVTSIPVEKRESGDTPIPFTLSQVSYFRYLQRARARSVATFDNLYYAGLLSGALDLRAVGKAIDALVDRHEILRVAPRERSGGQLEFVEKFGERPRLEEIDLAESEKAPSSDAFSRVISQIVLNSCSAFREKPLFRAVIARLGGSDYSLILVAHILICDGFSKNLLLRELGLLYGGFKKGESVPLMDLKVGWRDYANWERRRIEEHGFEPDVAYWVRQLDNHTPPRIPRVASGEEQKRSAVIQLPDKTRAKVARMAADEGAGEFAFYANCFAFQLAVYTSSTDIVIGTLSAKRTYVDLEPIAGAFVGVLFLRFRVNFGASFRDNFKEGIRMCREALQHQDVPLPLVWEALEERGTVPDSESKVRFNFGNHPRSDLELDGIEVQPLSAQYLRNETSGKFKFDIAADRSPLQVSLRYDGLGLLHRQCFLEDYSRFVRACLDAPEQSLEKLASGFRGNWLGDFCPE